MSVYTSVSPDELAAWLRRYSLGHLEHFEGILSGIENTNYFVTTSHGRYVLTLFERLAAAELPFYLNLMAHLAQHGVPCPAPLADLDNRYFSELNGKPAALVTRLPGHSVSSPGVDQCASVGEMLATMHLAGQGYAARMDNPHGPRRWHRVTPELLPFLSQSDATLLRDELSYQDAHRYQNLRSGPVHADLFRDNVLFSGVHVGGLIDFYFACTDLWLYDVAVTINDWCVLADGEFDWPRASALLAAYHAERPFTDEERRYWPVMLRAAALRFWLSRLYDYHLPRPGELTHKHDPAVFQRILKRRVGAGEQLPWV